MHAERASVSAATCEAVTRARGAGRRVDRRRDYGRESLGVGGTER